MALRAEARVNLAAIERNCATLRAAVGEGTALCAAVKANAYGHGTVPAARAALAGGATWLAVATADEAAELRAAALDASLLVLGALAPEDLPVALAAGADVVAWDEAFVRDLRAAAAPRVDAARRGPAGPGEAGEAAAAVGVHLKLDVGMGRLGTRDEAQLLRVADAVAAAPELRLAGLMMHFPSADEDLDGARRQLDAFLAFADRLRAAHPGPLHVHAANSAAALALPQARLDMVRCGIAVYGLDPWGRDAAEHGLEPALELRSYVAALKPLAPGETVGYGSRFVAREPTWIATVPIGYGDGVRRAWEARGEAIVGGRRWPLAGRVSMDNLCLDVGPERPAFGVGAPAVLIGAEGDAAISAEEVADWLGTIDYEVTTALTARVTRTFHRDGVPA